MLLTMGVGLLDDTEPYASLSCMGGHQGQGLVGPWWDTQAPGRIYNGGHVELCQQGQKG